MYDINYIVLTEMSENNGRKEIIYAINNNDFDLFVKILNEHKDLKNSFLITYVKDETRNITPLEAVIKQDQPEILNIILENEPVLRFEKYNFPLGLIIKYNSIKCMDHLIKNRNIDTNAEYYFDKSKNLLHVAIENDENEMAKLLIDNGANIFKESSNGNTPFYLACNSGNIDIINYFFDVIKTKYNNKELQFDTIINNINETINKINDKKIKKILF